jgi:hypothetical protein
MTGRAKCRADHGSRNVSVSLPSCEAGEPNVTDAQLSPPLHSVDGRDNVITVLNDRWRVIDDPLQWILQRQQGHNADGRPRYRNRSFCTSRRVLIRCIGEYCGDVDHLALAIVEQLPVRHLDWKRTRR